MTSTGITILHHEQDKFVEEISGFSLLIEICGKKILFDTSYSDDIIKNAKKGNICLKDIDCIVLSHGHIDHIEGLKFIDVSNVKNLVAHPGCFKKRQYRNDINNPEILEYLKGKIKITLSKEPYWIEKDKVVFLGEIPRTEFEGKKEREYLKNGKEYYLLDDSAVAIKTDKGLIIISGCSHSGICNIIEYAKEVCNDNRVYAVLGGFHLFDKNVTDKTIEYFKNQNIKHIYPMHCLNDYAFSEFKKIGAERISTLQKLSI